MKIFCTENKNWFLYKTIIVLVILLLITISINTSNYTFATEDTFMTATKPMYRNFEGEYVVLRKLDIETDIGPLYTQTHTTKKQRVVWEYLPYGPFLRKEEMEDFYKNLMSFDNRLVYCVLDAQKKSPVGIVALENIDPSHATIEIGGILYPIEHQRTKINTEVIYLLLRNCIEDLHYRRITWRCNNENSASKRAAQRLGFEFEGIFRHHMIVKNRNRDTAWFALLKGNWPALARNYRMWLYGEGTYDSLSTMNQKVKKFDHIQVCETKEANLKSNESIRSKL